MMEEKKNITKIEKRILYGFFWFFGLLPLAVILSLYLLQSEDDLPPVSMLSDITKTITGPNNYLKNFVCYLLLLYKNVSRVERRKVHYV